MTRRRSEPGRVKRPGSTMFTVAEPEYLDLAAVARLLGLKDAAYVHQLRWRYRDREPRFPEPDIVLGGHPGYRRETIERWNAKRPGRGVGGGRPRKQ